MADVLRGRLAESAPALGEDVRRLVDLDGIVIEHILSGELAEPAEYLQDHHEWVALVQGSADLEVMGERLSLTSGDWVLLPRRTPHRLLRTQAGTSWLAVRFG